MQSRLETLRQIVSRTPVGSQQELVRLLGRAGHRVTQSSVSRDLRELGVAKQGDHYVLLDPATPVRDDFGAVAAFVRDVRAAGPNLTVIRTTVGAAQSVAIVLDRADWPDVVGTISGDDTIFIATPGAPAQRRVIARLREKLRA